MIIKIGTCHVSDSLKELFEFLKSEEDLLVNPETDFPSFGSLEHEIRVMPCAERDTATIFVDTLEIKHEVPLGTIENEISKILGLILGYQPITLKGFTVRQANGHKISPEVLIFIKSMVGFHAPETMKYMKERPATQEFSENKSTPLISTSKIIECILKEGPIKFSSEDTAIVLMLHNGSIYMVPENVEMIPMIHRTMSHANAGTFLAMVCKASFKFVNIFIRAYSQPSSLEIRKELKKIFAELQTSHTEAEMEHIWKIVCAAPVFLDARDEVTEKIFKFYIYNNRGVRIKKGGAVYRIETHIDRNPIGSLKRYSYLGEK